MRKHFTVAENCKICPTKSVVFLAILAAIGYNEQSVNKYDIRRKI